MAAHAFSIICSLGKFSSFGRTAWFFFPDSTASEILQEILILVCLSALRICTLINKTSIDDDQNKYCKFLGIMS